VTATREVQVTLTFRTDATDEQIAEMVGCAGVQIEEASSLDGDTLPCETAGLVTDWFIVR
jgi:hypothetical protein